MRLLIDCDGVLSDFLGATLEAVEEVTGKRVDRSSIVNWNFFPTLPLTDLELQYLEQEISAPGFCEGLKVLPGTVDMMAALRRIEGLQIVFVTAPYAKSMTWPAERTNWLLRNGFAKSREEIVHTDAKHLISGDVFVDDCPENVYKWNNVHKQGTGIIWKQFYNTAASGLKVGEPLELVNFVKWKMRIVT